MVLKKKVIAGTIAASLTFTALAGLPLSDKGIAEKLGFSVAYAAEFPNATVNNWAQSIKGQLSVIGTTYTSSVASSIYLDTASVSSVTYVTYVNSTPSVQENVYDLAAPVIDKLHLEESDGKQIAKLFAGLTKFMFDQNTQQLEALRTNEAIRDALRELDQNITLEDLNDFLFNSTNGLQAIINSKISTINEADLLSASARQAFVLSIFNALLASNNKVSQALGSHEVGAAELQEAVSNFRDAVNPEYFDRAIYDLYRAYKAAYYASLGGGSNPGTPTPTVEASVAALVNDLAALKSQIAAATGDEKQKLIDQAVSKANAAIEKLVSIDASKLVSTVNGKATVSLSATDVTKLVTAVGDAKKALADAAGSADGLKVGAITLDLGAITQSGASVSLPKELWTLASDIKADGVAIKVGPMSATLPTGTFTEAVTLGLTVEAPDTTSASSSVYGKSVVSDVYNVDLEVGGKAVHEFNKPIKLRLPLKNLTGVDKELLSVARYEDDGSVSIQGGNVDGDYILEDRYKLSKYVVIENKVTFNDIARVEGWAGRQIQVVAAKGAIEGKSAGIFAPQDKITRAEFAKILITALNLDNTLATSSKFSDVPASHWAAPYIAVAAEKGIINGKTASTFAPNATITRAEMATMIARALKVTQDLKDIDNVEAALSVFKDSSKIGSAFRSSVAWAAASDIIIGANGKFLPNDNATRAEAAVIIYRAINFKPQA